jgi:hypothetical protein
MPTLYSLLDDKPKLRASIRPGVCSRSPLACAAALARRRATVHVEATPSANRHDMEIEMAEKDPITRIKELDAERTKLIDEAKKEALARAQQAVADLNALGFAYSLAQASVARKAVKRKAVGGIPSDNPCRICGFRTNPPHDARKHRFAKGAKKRAFNAKELADLGMRKV